FALGTQLGEPVGDQLFVHRAALESGQVPVDSHPGLGHLVLDGGEFGVPVGVRGPVLGLFVGDGVGDEVVPGAVEACQRVQNGRVHGVGVQALEVAFAGVVAGEVPAGVVAVGAVPPGGARADHGLAALRAPQAA